MRTYKIQRVLAIIELAMVCAMFIQDDYNIWWMIPSVVLMLIIRWTTDKIQFLSEVKKNK